MGTRIELLVTVAVKLFDAITYRLAPDRLNMIRIHRELEKADRLMMTNLQKIPS